MSVINLGRTFKQSIAFYQTDGMGRDCYITYNNGGFWKSNHIRLKSLSNSLHSNKNMILFHPLFHQPGPITYISDGSGRDSYIIEHSGGFMRTFEPLIKQKLTKFLRKNDEEDLMKHKILLTKSQKKYLHKIKRIQNEVVNRLYNDSMEKIKKNNLRIRNNSLNDIFINKQNLGNLPGIVTRNKNISLNNIRSIDKQNSTDQINENNNNNLNKGKNTIYPNSIKKKKIFGNFLKNNKLYKDNSAQNLGIFSQQNNNDRNMKLLKKIKLNSIGSKKLDYNKFTNTIDDKIYNQNNSMKFNSNFNSIYPERKINRKRNFGENNISYTTKNNMDDIKFNFN